MPRGYIETVVLSYCLIFCDRDCSTVKILMDLGIVGHTYLMSVFDIFSGGMI